MGPDQFTTSGNEAASSWAAFVQKSKSIRPYSAGEYILKTLPYIPTIIDAENRKNWVKRLLTGNDSCARSYLLYIPEKPTYNMPLIVLLHGTNQTFINTELVQQAGEKQAWFDLADREKLVIIVPQSRGLCWKSKMHYGWQPGYEDLTYLLTILQEVSSLRNQNQSLIQPKDINIIGFSNGGLFVSDLYLNYISLRSSKMIDEFGLNINFFCSYMGGIECNLDEQMVKVHGERKKTPLIIMTCPRQQNYPPCLRANDYFSTLDCNVCLIKVDHHKHEFTSDMVQIIYSCILAAKQKIEE